MSDQDWLKVVYRPELEMGGAPGDAPAPGPDDAPDEELVVHLAPPEIEFDGDGEPRRYRLTVVPAEPGLTWRVTLQSLAAASAPDGDAPRVWWRADPGSWQPLAGRQALVAEGRGRTRLDIALRLEGEGPAPALRFVASRVG